MTDKRYDQDIFEELDQVVSEFLLRHTVHHNPGQMVGDFLQSYVALKVVKNQALASQMENWKYLAESTVASNPK